MAHIFVVRFEIPVRGTDEEDAVHKAVLAVSDRMTDQELRGHIADVFKTEVKSDASTV